MRGEPAPPNGRCAIRPSGKREKMQPRCSSQMIWRGRVLAHRRDRVLVAEIVGAFDAVEGVGFGRVLFAVAERGIDAALRRAGVAADRVHFRDDGDVGTALGGFHRGAHAGETAADDDDVVLNQVTALSG